MESSTKIIMKKNFDEFVDKFFDIEDNGNEIEVLNETQENGVYAINMALGTTLSTIDRLKHEDVEVVKDEVKKVILYLVDASVAFGFAKFLKDMSTGGDELE